MEFVIDKKENKEISSRYKDLLRNSYQKLTIRDKKFIRKALEIAIDAHKNQRRKTGEPYIYHPLSVAKIVADEIGLGAISIASALLHDVVEDSPNYTIENLKELFGHEIANIVSGLTKINHLSKESDDISFQAENFKKLILTFGNDVRIALIKIADRLHNMRTMNLMSRQVQYKKASETLSIYAPLAHRLGLYNIKSDLEDFGLQYTNPQSYALIKNKLIETKEEQEKYISDFSKVIEEELNKESISHRIKGRSKSIYSIHKKMKAQNISFEEVFDRFAIRIIYKPKEKNEKAYAWNIYSIITDKFTPNNSRLRDWIGKPKLTGYEALHITVLGLYSKWVEIQIRSERMDEIAEKGYAAHYKYKNSVSARDYGIENWLNNIKELIENPSLNAVDFVEEFKLNLYSEEIYVFTPKGDIKELPRGANVLDFAFAIHTEVGSKCTGAKINGKLSPINTKLESGHIVEILTSPYQKPKADWLDIVKTSRAKSKIKSSLRIEENKLAAEGKEILRRKLKQLKIPFDEKTINQIVYYFKEKTSRELFYKVGKGILDSKALREFSSYRSSVFKIFGRLRRKHAIKSNQSKYSYKGKIIKKGLLVFGPDEQLLDYALSQCCNPIEGDPVFGFLAINKGIKIHREDCPNAIELQSNYGHRVIQAKWLYVDSKQADEYKVHLTFEGTDRIGITNEIAHIISNNMHIDIREFSLSAKKELFKGNIRILVKNKTQLNKLIARLKIVEGIKKVTRVYEN